MSDTIQAAEKSAAFVLRDLKSVDVWQMVRILKKFKLAEVFKQIDGDALKAAKFEYPLERTEEGSLVPLPREKWTEAQVKAFKKSKEASDAIAWQALDILMDNIGNCQAEVNTLLAMGIGRDREFVENMDAETYIDLIVQYVTREGFSDFFTHARGLLEKTGASRNFTATVQTLAR